MTVMEWSHVSSYEDCPYRSRLSSTHSKDPSVTRVVDTLVTLCVRYFSDLPDSHSCLLHRFIQRSWENLDPRLLEGRVVDEEVLLDRVLDFSGSALRSLSRSGFSWGACGEMKTSGSTAISASPDLESGGVRFLHILTTRARSDPDWDLLRWTHLVYTLSVGKQPLEVGFLSPALGEILWCDVTPGDLRGILHRSQQVPLKVHGILEPSLVPSVCVRCEYQNSCGPRQEHKKSRSKKKSGVSLISPGGFTSLDL